MPQLKEILEKEKQRTSPEQCTVVHLFREGTEPFGRYGVFDLPMRRYHVVGKDYCRGAQ